MNDNKFSLSTTTNLIFNLIGFIGALFVAIAYILWGYIDLTETGKSVIEIIGEGLFVFILTYSITTLLRVQGLLLGKSNKKFVGTEELFGETVEKVSPLTPFAEEFILGENESALKKVRTRVLSKVGLVYSDHFDEQGRFLENFYVIKDEMSKQELKRVKKKNNALNNAIYANVTMLQFDDLTSDETAEEDPNYLGPTERQYMFTRSLFSAVSSVGIAIVLGYYTYELIKDFERADLIYRFIQLAIALSLGLISMLFAYLFIVNRLRGRMINKINRLDKFYNTYKDKSIEQRLNIGFKKPNEGDESDGKSDNPGLSKDTGRESKETNGNEKSDANDSIEHVPNTEARD